MNGLTAFLPGLKLVEYVLDGAANAGAEQERQRREQRDNEDRQRREEWENEKNKLRADWEKEMKALAEDFEKSQRGEAGVPKNLPSPEEHWKRINRPDALKKLNIGFAGATNSGKSSLINALQEKEDEAPGAAVVEFTECTSFAQGYDMPGWKNTILWDLPGGGTSNSPWQDYFKRYNLHTYGCFVLVMGENVAAGSLDILKLLPQIADWKSTILIVRSKADLLKKLPQTKEQMQVHKAKLKAELMRNMDKENIHLDFDYYLLSAPNVYQLARHPDQPLKEDEADDREFVQKIHSMAMNFKAGD